MKFPNIEIRKTLALVGFLASILMTIGFVLLLVFVDVKNLQEAVLVFMGFKGLIDIIVGYYFGKSTAQDKQA